MTFPQHLIVSISAIEHYEYCPRQCALIHVDGVWEDNRSTVHGERAHRRVDSGEHRAERGRLVLRSIPLWSEQLGLVGRADAVEIHADGSVVSVEYKSGTRHGRAADLQACAQAMCLDEMLGTTIGRAYVWYGGTRRREPVVIDDFLRADTLSVVRRIRESIETGTLPRAPNDERCPSCQLLNHCLPSVVDDADSVRRYVEREVFGCDT